MPAYAASGHWPSAPPARRRVHLIWLAVSLVSFTLMLQAADISDPLNSVHSSLSGITDGIPIGRPSLDHFGNTLSRLLGDRRNVAIVIHLLTPGHLPQRRTANALLRRHAARL